MKKAAIGGILLIALCVLGLFISRQNKTGQHLANGNSNSKEQVEFLGLTDQERFIAEFYKHYLSSEQAHTYEESIENFFSSDFKNLLKEQESSCEFTDGVCGQHQDIFLGMQDAPENNFEESNFKIKTTGQGTIVAYFTLFKSKHPEYYDTKIEFHIVKEDTKFKVDDIVHYYLAEGKSLSDCNGIQCELDNPASEKESIKKNIIENRETWPAPKPDSNKI